MLMMVPCLLKMAHKRLWIQPLTIKYTGMSWFPGILWPTAVVALVAVPLMLRD